MITIQRTPLSYRVRVTPHGELLNSNLSIYRYMNRFQQTKWDPKQRRFLPIRRYSRYNDKNQTLYVPGYDLAAFSQFLNSQGVVFCIEDIPLQPGKPVEIQLKSWVQDRSPEQTTAIEYLTTSTESQRGLSSNPGFGKTYCTIKTISIIGVRAMICVSGLVDQWKREFLKYTEMTEDDIYIIQGAPSMTKLLQQIDKRLFPKVILCSLGTIRAYAAGDESYANYPPFTELLNLLQVGVKVIDEAHLNFHLTLMVDLQTNAAINIALTATFDRGDPQVKQIFDNHYPRLMRFGEGQFDRYVDIFSYQFSLSGQLPPKAYRTQEGYNHSKFEEYLLRRVPKMLEHIYTHVYSPAIYSHYINTRQYGQKLLVLCSRIEMCQWMADRMAKDLPRQENFKIALYTGESDDNVLVDVDIIVSTPGSAGTGTDIANLRAMLMTIATGSDNLNKQSLGRLRRLPTGDTPIYAYTWCTDIPQHQSYQNTRRNTYLARGKSFHELVM